MDKKIIYIGSNKDIEKKLQKIVNEVSSKIKYNIQFLAISEYESFIKTMKENTLCVPIFDYLGFNKYQDIL